jgi:hypothetical protein
MVSFKTKAKGVNQKALSPTTKKWLGAKSAGSSKSSFVAGTPAKSSASSGPARASSFSTDDRLLQQKIQRDTLNPVPVPTRTIVFKTVTPPAKVKKPGIWSPVVFKITPYVAPKPTVKAGTYVPPKKSSSGGGSSSDSGSSGGGPKIGTFHPDSANKAMMAPGGGKLRSKNIGTGGKTTY